MHPAVELLLKRMDSNPEEFISPHQRTRRWEVMIERYKPYMTDEDREKVKEKFSKLQMDKMHKEVMAELLSEEKPGKPVPTQFTLPFTDTEAGIF